MENDLASVEGDLLAAIDRGPRPSCARGMQVPPGRYFYNGEPITHEGIRPLPFYELARVQMEEVGPDGNVYRVRPRRVPGRRLLAPGGSFEPK